MLNLPSLIESLLSVVCSMLILDEKGMGWMIRIISFHHDLYTTCPFSASLTKSGSLGEKRTFLEAFLHHVQIVRPILVASSAGGMYAIPYVMEPEAVTCDSRAAGLVTVGVDGADNFSSAQYGVCKVILQLLCSTQ